MLLGIPRKFSRDIVFRDNLPPSHKKRSATGLANAARPQHSQTLLVHRTHTNRSSTGLTQNVRAQHSHKPFGGAPTATPLATPFAEDAQGCTIREPLSFHSGVHHPRGSNGKRILKAEKRTKTGKSSISPGEGRGTAAKQTVHPRK